MQSGQVILLNGTSSAGKSTLAKQLQEILPQPYLHTGIDHFLAAALHPSRLRPPLRPAHRHRPFSGSGALVTSVCLQR